MHEVGRRALALALLVGLAGCGALGPADDRTRAGTATVTPAPVPTTGSGPTPVDRRVSFPGVVDGRLRNGTGLARAHRLHLRNTSYRVVSNLSVRVSDGTLRRQNGTWWVAAGGERYRLARRTLRTRLTGGRAAGYEQLQVYRNGSRGWFRRVAAREVTSGRLARLDDVGDPTRAGDIRRLLDAFTVVVEDGRFGPQRQYDAVALGLTNPDALDPPARLTDPVDGRLVVAIDVAGVVRFYQVRYRARRGEAVVRVRRTVRFEDIGRVSVAEPDWVGGVRGAGS